jgi:hypothetical protein
MAVSTKRVSPRVTRCRIDVPDATLVDLAARLDRTRLPDEVDDGDWARDTHGGYLASLVRGPDPLLLLTHGSPDSFLRVVDQIPRLTDPAAHADRPTKTGTTFRIGELWHTLDGRDVPA